jgi:hypothetical protein
MWYYCQGSPEQSLCFNLLMGCGFTLDTVCSRKWFRKPKRKETLMQPAVEKKKIDRPKIVSPTERLAARKELLAKEKVGLVVRKRF